MPLLLTQKVHRGKFSNVSWIAAARIEEYDGKMETARKMIANGLDHCPDNEDIWLEATRLDKPDR